jgi:hypothetical protein
MRASQNATGSVEEGHIVSFLPALSMSTAHSRWRFLTVTVRTAAGVTLTGWASALNTMPFEAAA